MQVKRMSDKLVAKAGPSKPAAKPLPRYLQQIHEAIFDSNKKWVAARLDDDSQFFEKLSSSQHPDYL